MADTKTCTNCKQPRPTDSFTGLCQQCWWEQVGWPEECANQAELSAMWRQYEYEEDESETP